MTLATFNIPQEIKDRLKLEGNQSELVSKLLFTYFQDMGAENIEEQIKTLESTQLLQKETILKRIKELNTKLEERRKLEKEKQERKQSKKIVREAQEKAKYEYGGEFYDKNK